MAAPKNELKSVTRARLLEAAVLLFSRSGFNGTGTREIARLAEINESTLFRHYSSKKDLFWAALETRLTKLKFDRELQSALAGHQSPEVVLPMLFEFMVHTISEQPELMRLLYISALELPGGEKMYQKHLGAMFDSISTYLTDCVRERVICAIDPRMLTLALAGTVIATTSSYEIFVGQALPFHDVQEAAAGYSEFWLRILTSAPPLARRIGSEQPDPAAHLPVYNRS